MSLIPHIEENITSIINEDINFIDIEVDRSISEICEYFEIGSLNDLTSDMIEELTQSQLEKHKDISRGNLNARKFARYAIAAPLTLTLLAVNLSELGVIPTTEKHAFIRFQGLISTHSERIDNYLGGNKYKVEIKKIRDSIKLPENSSTQMVAEIYGKTTSSLLAIVISGYYKVMVKAGADKDQLSKIRSDLFHIGDTNVKGTSFWDRTKSGTVQFNKSTFKFEARPLISIINQFLILDKKNPGLNMKKFAQSKFKQLIK